MWTKFFFYTGEWLLPGTDAKGGGDGNRYESDV